MNTTLVWSDGPALATQSASSSASVPETAETLVSRAQVLSQEFAQQAEYHDRTGTPPAAQIQALFDAGLLRLTIAQQDGGHGAGLALTRKIVQTVAQGDPSVALILAMHYSHHASVARSRRQAATRRAWPETLAQTLITQARHQPSLVNAIQVEPGLGSPSHGGSLATTARLVDGQWRISGHKLYSTGSYLLSWLAVLAVTDEPTPRIGSFLVPREASGVSIVETWDPLGMRATASHDIILDDVVIPFDHAAGLYDAAHGLRRDPDAQSWYFNLIGSVYTGAAQSAQDWLTWFLNQRRPSALNGETLAQLPTVQDTVGRIQLWLDTSNALLDNHAQAYDAGNEVQSLGVTAKYIAVENAVQATALALELAGNHGISRNNPLERHYRNAQCARIHAPPNAQLRGNAGKAALQQAATATSQGSVRPAPIPSATTP